MEKMFEDQTKQQFMDLPYFDDLEDETEQTEKRRATALGLVEAMRKESQRNETLRKAVMPGNGLERCIPN